MRVTYGWRYAQRIPLVKRRTHCHTNGAGTLPAVNEPANSTRVSIDGHAWTVVPDPDTEALVAGFLALRDDVGREGLLCRALPGANAPGRHGVRVSQHRPTIVP